MEAKRQCDAASETDQPPCKRARLSGSPSKTARPSRWSLNRARLSGISERHGLKLGQIQDPSLRAGLQHPEPRTLAPSLGDHVNSESHTWVSQWLDSIGSPRGKRCQSEGGLRTSNQPIFSTKRPRSAPTMSRRDSNGLFIPRTPSSNRSRTRERGGSLTSADASSTGTSSPSAPSWATKLVENPFYRSQNLLANNIFYRRRCDPMPEHIGRLVENMRRDRTSPGPSVDGISRDERLELLQESGGEKSQVEQYFGTHIFPPNPPNLERHDRQPMLRNVVPNTNSRYRVSNPVPDMLYGYRRETAINRRLAQLASRDDRISGAANNLDLMYPFFAVEFKGDGPTRPGSLWVAVNQCLGASASCVSIADRLNRQLRECRNRNVGQIDSAAFSIAMNGTEARLYVSWKENDLDYYMHLVDSFALQRPEHYIEFRRYVRNILDWGGDRRLQEIRESLDVLLEEDARCRRSRSPSRGGSKC
ncbi:hypothetical protein XA68_16930 [Ophiocordyceps unilateralis]|uniref:DUF7924 domain-containing protein n=1 Tax=Ophiocordyceps unilateralis TaxID=268505 RepID=A0A2A9PL26_OPHUN|nr:hypothetical protein XA68_16930 [Ophiocordyceps unilateralis]